MGLTRMARWVQSTKSSVHSASDSKTLPGRFVQLVTRADWKIVYKGLIVAHIMIRDGAKEVALRYLAEQPRYFSVSHIAQGKNIPSA
jgi:ANTH domain